MDLPAQFDSSEQRGEDGKVSSDGAALGEELGLVEWWSYFEDESLQKLLRVGIENNRDRMMALARIEQAEAILGVTRADLFPTINVSGGAQRSDLSDKILSVAPRPQNTFGLLGALSYEVDLWGRVRRANEAERAQLLATEEASRAVTIALLGQIATTYFQILDLRNQLAIAEQTKVNRQGSTRVITLRFNKGILPELDVNQAQIQEADAAISEAAVERNLRQAENALQVLLGGKAMDIPQKTIMEVTLRELPPGVPAELLQRRPDLRAAEAGARSAVARIGVAKAERLPTISIAGVLGFQSRNTNELLSRDALTWNIGANFVGPLVDFGRTYSRVLLGEARAKEAMLNYEQSVIRAIQEVEDALVAVRTYRKEFILRDAQVKAAENAARLSRARYDDGFTSFLEVLDIERSLFEAQLGASQTRRLYFASLVQLYRSVGGGWSGVADDNVPLAVKVQ